MALILAAVRKWIVLTCSVAVLAVGATCSVERVVFSGAEDPASDASVADDAIRVEDGPPTEDAPVPEDAPPDSPPDAPPPLGAPENPARTCIELEDASMPSGLYWLRHPDGMSPPFEVYCEQDINGGGWAMLENSVPRADGSTTAFWRISYADRLNRFGTPSPDDNYYDGSLYKIGTVYMDIFVDLEDKLAVAAVMTAIGIDDATMRFQMPAPVSGSAAVYNAQFASGWSTQERDGDPFGENCAVRYSGVTQHYSTCWVYNLGTDQLNDPLPHGDVGPHVNNDVLTSLGLGTQPGGGSYSEVKRIARFTRW